MSDKRKLRAEALAATDFMRSAAMDTALLLEQTGSDRTALHELRLAILKIEDVRDSIVANQDWEDMVVAMDLPSTKELLGG